MEIRDKAQLRKGLLTMPWAFTSRSEAFRSLVGVEHSGETTQFPEQIVLPELVDARTLDAVNATVGDRRERSIHFRHKDGDWRGGLALRGPKAKQKNKSRSASGVLIEGARTNRWDGAIGDIFSPHLHLHTHPSSPKITVGTRVNDPEGAIRLSVESAVSELLAMTAFLPSSTDIRLSLIRPHGSIANLVASEWGRFLWVHRDIAVTEGPLRSIFLPKGMWKVIRHKDPSASHVISFPQDPAGIAKKAAGLSREFWSRAISSCVEALDKAYVCYMGLYPEDTTLQRVREVSALEAIDPWAAKFKRGDSRGITSLHLHV